MNKIHKRTNTNMTLEQLHEINKSINYTNDKNVFVCEKSLADKTEKLCLKCGYGIGSNVPIVGLINGVTFHASVLKYAVDIGTSAGVEAAISKGMEEFVSNSCGNFRRCLKSR
ncbi:hypothetical protein PFTANZ_00437 [Plasmodium falciparum Tanzania (2000708)]|uniref:Uncharacterized protein n=1 Tax=Plasmodium falciparum Tanzania (2000708) TaxID=1036725 RepID=A0A024WD84_PLAFA|nr:hypothetical protein PFTANZ_00437 [Plasmodium falciparum Tanzania (2000708)]